MQREDAPVRNDHDDSDERAGSEGEARRGRTWHQISSELLRLFARADAAYAPFSCPATAECCQLSTTRREPWLWPVEWRLLEEHARRAGIVPFTRSDGGCSFLDEPGKRCRVYAARPLGCRTFFCQRRTGPSREPAEVMSELSLRIERLSLELWPEVSAPRPITAWLAASKPEGR